MPSDLQLPSRPAMSRDEMRRVVNNVTIYRQITGRGLFAAAESIRHNDIEMAQKCHNWLITYGDMTNKHQSDTLNALDQFINGWEY
jgi:hypothetical protein